MEEIGGDRQTKKKGALGEGRGGGWMERQIHLLKDNGYIRNAL